MYRWVLLTVTPGAFLYTLATATAVCVEDRLRRTVLLFVLLVGSGLLAFWSGKKLGAHFHWLWPWIVVVAVVRPGHPEQVERPAGWQRLGGQPADPGPGPAGIGSPAAEQQPVRRRDVPARGEPHAVGDQVRRRLARPHRPPGPQRLVRPPDRRGEPGTGRHRPGAFCRGHAEPCGGGDDQPHEVAAGHPGLAQRRHEIHGPNPATDDEALPGPAAGLVLHGSFTLCGAGRPSGADRILDTPVLISDPLSESVREPPASEPLVSAPQ